MSFSAEQHKRDTPASLPELDIQHLERMNNEEFWNYARQRAYAVPERTSYTECLECKLSSGVCLVPLDHLAEALPPPARLTALPGMPAWMAGLTAWHGETIAVVELDAYFSPARCAARHTQAAGGTLLVMHTPGCTLGLLAPASGRTTTIEPEHITRPAAASSLVTEQREEVFAGMYSDLPVMNITALLADLVQQIGGRTVRG